MDGALSSLTPSACSSRRRRGRLDARRCTSLAPWSRLGHCFAGARSWWHGSGRSWKDAVLVEGLGNVIIMPRASSAYQDAPVIRRARLGGLLNYYERAAA